MLPFSPDRKTPTIESPDVDRDTPWGRVRGLIDGKAPRSPERNALAIQAYLLAARGRIRLDGGTPDSELPYRGMALTDAISSNNFYGPRDSKARVKEGPYAQVCRQFDELLPKLLAEEEQVLTEPDLDRRRVLAEMAVGRKLRKLVNSQR